MKIKKIIIILIIIILLLGTHFVSAPLSVEKNKEFWKRERLTAVISSPDIIPFLLGFESVFANYLWIRTMLYVGGNIIGENDGKWLKEMITAVNMLNPSFYPAYEFAALMLPNITGDWEGARLILEKGIPHISEKQRRFGYFYLGWIYFSRYQDFTRAAELFAFAGQDPNSPPHWRTLSATMLSEAGRNEQAMRFLLELYENTDNPQVKTTLRERIERLSRDISEGNNYGI